MAWDNSASCKTKMKWDDDVLYVNGLTCDNSASSIIKRNDKALYNNQLDKALHTFATTTTIINKEDIIGDTSLGLKLTSSPVVIHTHLFSTVLTIS